MITKPSGEASVLSRDDRRSSGSPAVGAQSQASLPADAPVASTPESAAQQDVDQASTEPATSRPTSASGDEDQLEDEAAAGHRQQPKEATGQPACPAPDSLETTVSPQSPVWDRPAQDSQMTQSPWVSQSDSLVEKKTPRTLSVPSREEDLDPPTPSTQVQFPQNVPPMSAADADSQPDAPAALTETAAEKSEGSGALSPDTEALPSAEPQSVTEGHSVDCSGVPQALPVTPCPGGSALTLPGAPTVAQGWKPLDSSLNLAMEESSYMRSMTSLLARGKASIGSLADVLVWSETTMDTPTGLLASGHSSVTDLLCSTGPRLHSVSSLLQSARSAFSSWLATGTGLVLHSITHLLERMEQRTAEGICLAMHYLTGHLTPYHSGLSGD
ncbi:testis-expressed protein 44 [Artibeus jamaicensis]|uniref:testis-expressed protein 44 n=1 Tax=Artibeus jamaicensis TaxID=9417 RepID=UPI00235AD5D7|nr:testis-expressed protein 44 [Artibeus jamaicensis]